MSRAPQHATARRTAHRAIHRTGRRTGRRTGAGTSRRGRARAIRLAAVALAAVLLTNACSEPGLPETPPPPEGAEDVLTEDAPDPVRDELVGRIDALTTTVTEARDRLDDAAAAQDTTAIRSASRDALALLLDDPGGTTADGGTDTPALFPSRTTDRGESSAQDDLLTATLTAARQAGGTLGRATVETLRDPVAGDLGAWERDAQGVVDDAASTVAGARDADAIEEAVLTLPGDGVRALAWTFLAEDARDPELARAAAERASGHLNVVLIGLGILRDEEARPNEPADVPPSGETEDPPDGAA